MADHAWTLLQWPGDPDRGPHPGDLIDLVGRANAQWLRRAAEGSAAATAEIHGVPCARFDIDEGWATQAALTAQPGPPSAAQLDEVLEWLQRAKPGAGQVRVRAEHVDDPVLARLTPTLELGVCITERYSRFQLPEDIELGEARDADEFIQVYGEHLAPLVNGQIGRPGRSFLVLRECGRAVGCARVTEAGGTAYVSGVTVLAEHRGKGLGQLISAAATNHAVRRAGLAWLHCDDHMAPLYEGLGYRRLTTHVDLRLADQDTKPT